MRTVALREAKQQLSDYISQSQKDHVLITKHGRPSAIIRGVEGRDFEDVMYMTNPSFWHMIRRRRSAHAVPWKQAKKELK